MKLLSVLVLLSSSVGGIQAYNTNKASPAEASRRSVLATVAATAAAAMVAPRQALADDDVATPLYFGVGVSSF